MSALTACITSLILVAAPATAADFHVSPDGNDAWSGRRAAAAADGTDGPVAGIHRAVALAREARAADPEVPRRIILQAGRHVLAAPVELGPQDSGLVIEAAEVGQVVVSGGRRITGWRPWRGEILQADLSALDLPDLRFHVARELRAGDSAPPRLMQAHLYYNGRLMPWARVPNLDADNPRRGGFLQNAGIVEADTKTKFHYREGDLQPENWPHPERAWIRFHDSLNYETQFCPVKSIDIENRVIEAERGVYRLSEGNPFYLAGILEELDAPGEWCEDPDTQTLHFRPPSGDPNGNDEVVVPAVTSAFVLAGNPAEGEWVEHVRIVGLDIRDLRGRAIQMTGARHCSVVACDLRNAEVGVYLGDDTHHCRVAGNDITQTQGDGISILGTSMDHDRVSDHVIENNYIRDFGWGRIHNRCGGVYMHRCARIRVLHNHIHDGPRYAIGMDVGNDCEIAYNYCHHVNLVTADTGIIEAATAHDWRLPTEEQAARQRPHNWGNRVHHNLLHDSGGWGTDRTTGELLFPHYSWGIYLDTHCSGWHIHDNVVYNTVLGGFMLNCGQENVIENNIFLDGKISQVQFNPWPRYVISDNRFERNVVAYQGGSARLYTLNRFEDTFVHFADNLIWAGGDTPEVRFPAPPGSRVRRGRTWEAWLGAGRDAGSRVADPLFADPDNHDYRLRPDSPAFALGFRQIDLGAVGNYDSEERRTWPRPEEPVVRPPADYAPGPRVFATQPTLRDYEDYVVGERERGGDTNVGEQGAGTVRVTDETAASGRHSLRFTDAPGLTADFFPYVTYNLQLDEGRLEAGFDLRVEPGAIVVYEWRDDPYYYNLGPMIRVDGEGRLAANNRFLLEIPHGEWVRVDITCGLGEQATGAYDLTLRLPGQEPQTFTGLECSPDFRFLECVVFMSMATDTAVFQVDNVEFRPRQGAAPEQ